MLANVENAKKGGPKTEAGKAAVRFNALKHGLLCEDWVVLPLEKKSKLFQLRKELINDVQPQGQLEMMFVERIVSSYWRMARAITIEANWVRSKLYGDWEVMAEEEFAEKHTTCMNLLRYETTIERQFYRALHELQRLQMARQGSRPPAPIALDVDVSKEE